MPEPIWCFVTRTFTVRVDALPEEDLDLSWDETGEVAKGLESGRYSAFCARAQVLDSEGRVLAADYLGNCIYESAVEFSTAHRDPDPLNRNCSIMRAVRGSNTVICHYFPSMVLGVCRDARAALRAHAALYLRPTA
jgi:hypothetical protein